MGFNTSPINSSVFKYEITWKSFSILLKDDPLEARECWIKFTDIIGLETGDTMAMSQVSLYPFIFKTILLTLVLKIELELQRFLGAKEEGFSIVDLEPYRNELRMLLSNLFSLDDGS